MLQGYLVSYGGRSENYNGVRHYGYPLPDPQGHRRTSTGEAPP